MEHSPRGRGPLTTQPPWSLTWAKLPSSPAWVTAVTSLHPFSSVLCTLARGPSEHYKSHRVLLWSQSPEFSHVPRNSIQSPVALNWSPHADHSPVATGSPVVTAPVKTLQSHTCPLLPLCLGLASVRCHPGSGL